MRVSVVVPTYRRTVELKRALLSLVAQDFNDFETIVVDDNADSDWCGKVKTLVESIAQAHPDFKISYIRNEERCGSAESRNEGIRMAQGCYITFLDDDDEYLPNKISNQYTYMVENQLDYSITDLSLFFDTGKLSEYRTRSYIKKKDKISLLEYHFMYHLTGTDTIMMRKDYLEKIGYFPPINIGDEFYLMQKAIEADGKFGYLNVCDVRAYVHIGEGGLSSGEGKLSGEKKIFENKKQFFHMMSRKSVRYIHMRHYSVMAFACLRMKNYWLFVKYGMLAFLHSPIQCVHMILTRK